MYPIKVHIFIISYNETQNTVNCRCFSPPQEAVITLPICKSSSPHTQVLHKTKIVDLNENVLGFKFTKPLHLQYPHKS